MRKAHTAEMKKAGCDVEAMIAFRQKMHSYPEGRFNEVVTQQLLNDTLLGFGVEKQAIKKCAKTGLVVDIKGSGKPSGEKGGCKTIAIRADIDGLPMPENNKDLPYCSKTKFAHMCGHDGHTAMLLAATQVV